MTRKQSARSRKPVKMWMIVDALGDPLTEGALAVIYQEHGDARAWNNVFGKKVGCKVLPISVKRLVSPAPRRRKSP